VPVWEPEAMMSFAFAIGLWPANTAKQEQHFFENGDSPRSSFSTTFEAIVDVP
jgi:hypothetical protein